MKMRNLIVMVFTLLALCGLYVGQEVYRQGKVAKAFQVRRIFDFEPGAIERLTIAQLGEEPSTAERTGEGGWTMLEPNPSIKPLDMLWDRVCRQLAILENFRTIEESPDDLSSYGLEQPVLVVKGTAGGEDFSLRFGSEEPTRTYRYTQLNDGKIILVRSRPEYFELDRPLTTLRDSFLVQDLQDPLVRLEYARILSENEAAAMENPPLVGEESDPVVLERDDAESPWRMTAPVEAMADQERVEALANEVQFGKGQNYIENPQELSVYRLAPARARITVVPQESQKPETLYIGDVDLSDGKGNLFARKGGQDAVFQISPNILTLVPESPTDFREARLFTGEASKIASVEFTSETEEFVLARVGNDWVMIDPPLDDIDTILVSRFLDNYKRLRVRGYLPGTAEANGLDTPSATVKFTYEDGSPPVEFRFQPDSTNPDYYNVTQDTGGVAQIYTAQANALIPRIDQFRSRNLFDVPAPLLGRIEFRFEGESYALKKVHDRWIVVHPTGMRLSNQSDVATIVRALSPVESLGFEPEPDTDLSAYGLTDPVFAFTAYTEQFDAQSTATQYGPFLVGEPVSNSPAERYAMVSGRDGVFHVSRGVLEAVSSALEGLVESGSSESVNN